MSNITYRLVVSSRLKEGQTVPTNFVGVEEILTPENGRGKPTKTLNGVSYTSDSQGRVIHIEHAGQEHEFECTAVPELEDAHKNFKLDANELIGLEVAKRGGAVPYHEKVERHDMRLVRIRDAAFEIEPEYALEMLSRLRELELHRYRDVDLERA